MPEGPECRRYALFLGDYIGGETLTAVEVVSGRYLKKELPNLNSFKEKLPSKVKGVGVHGKFIYVIFEDKSSMWSTLGMSGAWQSKESKHTRLSFTFDTGKRVYFNDMRNFGTIKLSQDPKQLSAKLSSFGPDMLSEDVSNDDFVLSLRNLPT